MSKEKKDNSSLKISEWFPKYRNEQTKNRIASIVTILAIIIYPHSIFLEPGGLENVASHDPITSGSPRHIPLVYQYRDEDVTSIRHVRKLVRMV